MVSDNEDDSDDSSSSLSPVDRSVVLPSLRFLSSCWRVASTRFMFLLLKTCCFNDSARKSVAQ